MTDEERLPVIRRYVASRGDKADGWFITLLRLLDAKDREIAALRDELGRLRSPALRRIRAEAERDALKAELSPGEKT